MKKIKSWYELLLFIIATGQWIPKNGIYENYVRIQGKLVKKIPGGLTFESRVSSYAPNLTIIGDNCKFKDGFWARGGNYITVGNGCTFEQEINSDCKLIGEEVYTSERIGSRKDYTYYFPKVNTVICGCFWGTLEVFEDRVNNYYPDAQDSHWKYRQYGEQYRLLIQKLKDDYGNKTNESET